MVDLIRIYLKVPFICWTEVVPTYRTSVCSSRERQHDFGIAVTVEMQNFAHRLPISASGVGFQETDNCVHHSGIRVGK